jgi:hypothetical protein
MAPPGTAGMAGIAPAGTPGTCGTGPIKFEGFTLVRDEISVGNPGIGGGMAPPGTAGMAGIAPAGTPKLLKPGHPPNCGAPDATKAKVANKQIWKTAEP